MVYRIYVEKKQDFATQARHVYTELHDIVGILSLQAVRIINRYDIEGIDETLFNACIPTVFSEPQVDTAIKTLPLLNENEALIAVEYLPGQFDQRAESAAECIQLISQGERPKVATATLYILSGDISQDELERIKKHLVNPVEARLASLDEKDTLEITYHKPDDVEVIHGFISFNKEELSHFIVDRGLAMDASDIAFCQEYFQQEQRDPTIAEIRMIDTYWSDHCRHTTFNTELDEITFDDDLVKKAFDRYLNLRETLQRTHKPISLMDMGTIGAKALIYNGKLKNLDESKEINACTVKITCDVNGKDEDWLFLFKNETHNHPTEIEPFGGAATCVGGAIRDPLSGRSYVYQAMRVTGAGNPLTPIHETLPAKLPQRKIVLDAAQGYSSYGNQIGLATGLVDELYHPGYVAKRMEIGAVVGAAPAKNVKRERPVPGDKVILLGGKTGRDGIGGATGSSKAHTSESIETCGAEVQKGNAPVERKIQRLFKREDAATLIRRCNDFGAGGVSVAVGELADSLDINLDAVPTKYEGLDGTEIAISESQERMAVVLDKDDVQTFLKYAAEENLDACQIAEVTDTGRVRMTWLGTTIVDLSRVFLDSNGASKHAHAHIAKQNAYTKNLEGSTYTTRFEQLVCDINVASKKGLQERFDSTIGAATVLMPFGGTYQLTPAQAMVAKLPVEGATTTCSAMAWGFNPYISEKSPYAGSYIAVVESIAKLIATGFTRSNMYLTFQEYFEKLADDPIRWGKPVAALLGALDAQLDMEIGSIGGKDSMSGSFNELDVPPTLVSFAVATGKASKAISPEFKAAGHKIILLKPHAHASIDNAPDPASFHAIADYIELLHSERAISAIMTPGYGGIAESLFKMTVGNRIGAKIQAPFDIFDLAYGSFIIECDTDFKGLQSDKFDLIEMGTTTQEYELIIDGEHIDLAHLQDIWESVFSDIMPYKEAGKKVEQISSTQESTHPHTRHHIARPRVIIPVFPGTNCEYDTAAAFEKAGGVPEIFVINNLTPHAIAESARLLAEKISQSQIMMIPGGFSGGDEPDGSAKFITAFLRNPYVADAIHTLLNERDGLMLGICNGFQALVKLGLVPFGEIRNIDESYPTLTFNEIGRHQSRLVRTRISSVKSPWLSKTQVGDIHTVAISHGEGRFVANETILAEMIHNGQIATQYCDESGQPSMDLEVNPNGSILAIEGITSPNGRVFGKMGHSERAGSDLYANIPRKVDQPLFEGGVSYFE